MLMQSWLRGARSCLFGSRRMRRGAKRQRLVSQTATATAAETFEIRQYPAATMMATLTAGVLNIEGTTSADTITVQQTGDQLAVRNGTTVLQIKVGTAGVNQVAASQVQLITINSLGGDDTIRLGGVSIAANINGGDGIDKITGGNGNDTLTGGVGNDTLNGGGGVNTLVESGNVNFTLTNPRLTGNGTDRLSNITLARLTGGAGNNTLNASAFSGSVMLDGAAGKDVLIGGNSADELIGGLGNDNLTGNGGVDVLEGGGGNDNLNGGGGDDWFVFSGSASLGTDTIAVGDNQGTNTLDFSQLSVGLTRLDLGQTTSQVVNSILMLKLGSNNAIDNVNGTDLADTIVGNALDNQLVGRGGNDVLVGNGGTDQLSGGAGLDQINGVSEDQIASTTVNNLGSRTHVFLVNGVGDNGINDNFDRGRYDDNDYLSRFQSFGFDVHVSDWDNLHTQDGHGPDSSDQQFVTDLANQINSYGPSEHVILIGHSYGGDSILKVANATTHQIDLLATLDPVGPLGFRSSVAKDLVTHHAASGGGWFSDVIHIATGDLGGILMDIATEVIVDGVIPNFLGLLGVARTDNLPLVGQNVGYFYNRWQTDGAFPIDYKTDGSIGSRASGSLLNDFGIVDQRRDDVAQRGLLGGAHKAVPNDPLIQSELASIVFGISLVVTESDGSRSLVLPGTANSDHFRLEGNRGSVAVTWEGHSQATVRNIDRVRFVGGFGDDSLDVNDTFNVPIFADGGSGNDTLNGGAMNDTLLGGSANDKLRGGAGLDSLDGQDGNDELIGGDGNDLLRGGADDDRLDGQQGEDIRPIKMRLDIVYLPNVPALC